MIVLVTGGRGRTEYATIEKYLDMLHALHRFTRVIHGDNKGHMGRPGVDRMADQWAKSRHIEVKPYPAEWDVYGKAAGPLRNARMLNEGQPDLVVAFFGGKGTGNMKKQAASFGVTLIDLAEESVRLQIEANYRALDTVREHIA